MDDTIYMLIFIGRMQKSIGYAVAARDSFLEAERHARADGWDEDELAIIRVYLDQLEDCCAVGAAAQAPPRAS